MKQESMFKELDEYFAQWGSMFYIQMGAQVKEIIDKHLGKEIE